MGPLRVPKKIGHVAYKLELPPKWSIHDVFHVSLLKPYLQRGEKGVIAALPVDWLEEEPLYEVEQFLAHSDTRVGRTPVRRYLINYDHMHNSWERESNLINCSEALEAYWKQHALQAARARRIARESTD